MKRERQDLIQHLSEISYALEFHTIRIWTQLGDPIVIAGRQSPHYQEAERARITRAFRNVLRVNRDLVIPPHQFMDVYIPLTAITRVEILFGKEAK